MLGGAGKNYSALSNSDSWVIELCVLPPGSPVTASLFCQYPRSLFFLSCEDECSADAACFYRLNSSGAVDFYTWTACFSSVRVLSLLPSAGGIRWCHSLFHFLLLRQGTAMSIKKCSK